LRLCPFIAFLRGDVSRGFLEGGRWVNAEVNIIPIMAFQAVIEMSPEGATV
jgi:hypothetical protein